MKRVQEIEIFSGIFEAGLSFDPCYSKINQDETCQSAADESKN